MLRLLRATLIVLLVLACAPAHAGKFALSGAVTYREKIALPSNATLRIRLVDQSAPDTPTRVEATAPISGPGQVPLRFNLNFDDKVLVPGHGYGLVAEIIADNRLFFQNFEPYTVDLTAPAAAILIVTIFVGKHESGTAAGPVTGPASPPPAAGAAIIDTVWHATAIENAPVLPRVDASLSITADMRAGGRGGCNSYFTQAQITDTAIGLNAVTATRMACADEIMAQETRFFDALAKARFWRIEAGILLLIDGAGAELLHFRSE